MARVGLEERSERQQQQRLQYSTNGDVKMNDEIHAVQK